jgi:DtxR family Mn-dependent transcriptional regulator
MEAVETWKEFDHNIITHSAAHHLMAIDDLFTRLGYARVSDIARELGITRGSVSISLRTLKDSALVLQDENRHLRLSPRGQALVDAVKTKRALMKRLFAEVLGVPPGQAEIDACKLEHLVSNATARRLIAFFRFLDSDPRGTRSFREAWQAYEAACNHEPAACPTCETGCMAEKVQR